MYKPKESSDVKKQEKVEIVSIEGRANNIFDREVREREARRNDRIAERNRRHREAA